MSDISATTTAKRPRSGGPRTPAGSARSSLNALKHGFTARTFVLQNESPEQFAEILKTYSDSYSRKIRTRPAFLRTSLQPVWRLLRIRRYETAAPAKAFPNLSNADVTYRRLPDRILRRQAAGKNTTAKTNSRNR
jgi:hypothetical protein